MQQLIPLSPLPNQKLPVVLSVDGNSLSLTLVFHYNEVAGYYTMTVINSAGATLLDSIPLLTGNDPVCNILRQYSYLQIGSAFLINLSGTPGGNPNNTNLGSAYVLLWGDTP